MQAYVSHSTTKFSVAFVHVVEDYRVYGSGRYLESSARSLRVGTQMPLKQDLTISAPAIGGAFAVPVDEVGMRW